MSASSLPADQCQVENLDQLVSMGYPIDQCLRALEVSNGDLEQAVGYLLMGEVSQSNFDYSVSESISEADEVFSLSAASHHAHHQMTPDVASARGSLIFSPPFMQRHEAPLPGASEAPPPPPSSSAAAAEDQLVMMGYTRNSAIHALRVAEGDLEQAVNFLLMQNSRQGLLLDVEHFGSERTLRSSVSTTTRSSDVASDVAVASNHSPFAVRRTTDCIPAQAPPSIPRISPAAHNPLPYSGPKPKIVSTRTFLSVPGAGPFCVCFAASRFLTGGVVDAPFLDGVMESGIELYRRLNYRRLTIGTILQMYGRSHVGILFVNNGEEDPKRGLHTDTNLQHEKSIRRLMAICRNEQEAGWQIILLELQNDSFCACLPPKGSGNKFWFFDFGHRHNVRTSGAYALVHNSLLQMEETIEAIVGSIGRSDEVDHVPFALYRIKEPS